MEIDLGGISLDEEDEENRPVRTGGTKLFFRWFIEIVCLLIEQGPSNARALASYPHNIETASPIPTENSIARDRKSSGTSRSHPVDLKHWDGESLVPQKEPKEAQDPPPTGKL